MLRNLTFAEMLSDCISVTREHVPLGRGGIPSNWAFLVTLGSSTLLWRDYLLSFGKFL